jgi:hypothetical protein
MYGRVTAQNLLLMSKNDLAFQPSINPQTINASMFNSVERLDQLDHKITNVCM